MFANIDKIKFYVALDVEDNNKNLDNNKLKTAAKQLKK